MLRLWPERVVAGIFPQSGWLHIAGRGEVSSFTTETARMQLVPAGLNLLLREQKLPKHAGVELLVSDSLARVIPIPWQERLATDTQREAYARACFDHAGMSVDGEWLVRAAYRHFRGVGLAYALPRALVSEVRDHLNTHTLRLLSILPLSASAYWRNQTGVRRKRSILVLQEHQRLDALLFDGAKCAGFHVQPAGTRPLEAARRLLSEVDAVFPGVKRIQWWSLDDDAAGYPALFENQFAPEWVDRLQKSFWR